MPSPTIEQIAETYVPQTDWVDDFQGKKNFDCSLLVIDTRYWPERYQQNGMCSAKCTIGVNFNGDVTPLISKEFEGHSDSSVKTQVELWVTSEARRLLTNLLTLGYGETGKE